MLTERPTRADWPGADDDESHRFMNGTKTIGATISTFVVGPDGQPEPGNCSAEATTWKTKPARGWTISARDGGEPLPAPIAELVQRWLALTDGDPIAALVIAAEELTLLAPATSRGFGTMQSRGDLQVFSG